MLSLSNQTGSIHSRENEHVKWTETKFPNPIFVVTKDLFFSSFLWFLVLYILYYHYRGNLCVCVFVRCLGPIISTKKGNKNMCLSLPYLLSSFPFKPESLRAKLSNPFTEYNLLKIQLWLNLGWFIKFTFCLLLVADSIFKFTFFLY
jgi:hypothetical protein